MKKPLLGRAGRLLGALAVGTTLFSAIALSGAVPAGAVTYHGGGLVSTRDTPDPDVVYSGHGTSYYTYSTGTMGLVTADWTNGGIGFTPLSCTSGGCGITGVTHTALTAYTHPSIPRRLNLGLFGLQAPSVVHLNSGTWVMYYGGAEVTSPHNAYAVWVATATHPTATDGFTSSLTELPIMYQSSTGGSTDPSVFTSPSGTRSLQWKSSTYRTDGDKARLWSMPLTATGLSVSGSASILITQPTTGWDSATVENPDMIYSGGTYYLFFSGGLWTTTGYGEGYVTCSSASGGCGSPTGAPFLSNSSSVPYGPGGASLFPSVTGSWLIAYHGWNTSCTKYVTSCNGSRQLYVRLMTGLAATPLPKITSFAASPSSLPSTGGTVTFSVISPNMTNYSISSSPAVAGLPAERPTIHLPANTTGSPITYTFTATTNNTAGFQTATASVTVAPVRVSLAATTPSGSTNINDFAMGSNGALYQTYEQSNGFFSAWSQTGTSFPGGQIKGLAATSPSGSTNINDFAMGSNGALYQTYEQSNGLFSAWTQISTSFPGGQIEGLAATSPSGSTNINVFAMGSNGALYQTYEQSNGLFSAWSEVRTSFPGGQLEGGLTATTPAGSTNINVFAMGSNGALYQTYEQSNGLFSAWSEVRTSFPGGQLEGGLTATTPAGSTNINVFAMGSNGALYQTYEQSNGLFSAWSEVRTSFPGGQLEGGLTATTPAGSTNINVFAMGSNGALYQAYEQSNGFFTAWTQISTSFPGG